MLDNAPSRSQLIVSDPDLNTRTFEMSVTVPKLRSMRQYVTTPWVRVTANIRDDSVSLAAGIRITRPEVEDDGA
jgi:hypothetical protein